MHKISIRWVDGMISVFDVENFQILPGHVWMRYTDGKERWVPNALIRYVDYDSDNKNTKSGDGCLVEQIKDVMLKRRLCGMEKSTISEIEDDLIATGTRPDNEKLIHTLNRMTEDGVIQTFLGVGNSKESGSVMDILYALMR